MHALPHREADAGPAARSEMGRTHEGGPPQDQAVYTCQCGYVFEATVSTSVDCPHCGAAQAW
jgi:rubrerythrin